MLLAGCSQDEPMVNGGDSALTIVVADNGYSDSESQSRTVDNEYSTEFAAGDVCGIYVVRNGAVVVDNARLTATASGGTITWNLENGVTLGDVAGDRYFLYYPYHSDAKAAATVSDTDTDSEFFADLIAGWIVSPDQSTHEKYSASDLMTAEGVLADNDGKHSLTFTMKHRMALTIIELPVLIYHFTNPGLSDYVVKHDADFSQSGYSPYRMPDGSYRLLHKEVKYPAPAEYVQFEYLNGTKTASARLAYIPSGSYIKFKIEGGAVEKTHTLQIGDYILDNGHLLAKDTETSELFKSRVSGIVFWVNDTKDLTGRLTPASLTDDKIMAAEHPGCNHALAVSFPYRNTTRWYNKDGVDIAGFQKSDNFKHPMKEDFADIIADTEPDGNMNRILGYQNTVILRAYNDYCKANDKEDYVCLAMAPLDTIQMQTPAPYGSTGWFLPSVKECALMAGDDIDNVYSLAGKAYFDTYEILLSIYLTYNIKDIDNYGFAYRHTSSLHNNFGCWNFYFGHVLVTKKIDINPLDLKSYKRGVFGVCAF